MFRYNVIFSVSADANPGSHGFFSESTMSNVNMVVNAMHPSQAKSMVENMYGGAQRCFVKSVVFLGNN